MYEMLKTLQMFGCFKWHSAVIAIIALGETYYKTIVFHVNPSVHLL